jgi:hypothetical protein
MWVSVAISTAERKVCFTFTMRRPLVAMHTTGNREPWYGRRSHAWAIPSRREPWHDSIHTCWLKKSTSPSHQIIVRYLRKLHMHILIHKNSKIFIIIVSISFTSNRCMHVNHTDHMNTDKD